MSKEEILQQLQGHMESLFDIESERVKPESRIYQDLGLDSIDAVDLVVQLQRATGKKIKPEDFKTVRTVEDIVNAVDKLLKEG